MQENSYPYRIFLKGPWQYRWLGPIPEGEDFPEQGTVRMPASWESVFGYSTGIVKFQRTFHRPTNLEPNEKVFLVLEGVGGFRELVFNECDITEKTTIRTKHIIEVELTKLLNPFNRIEVIMEWAESMRGDTPGGLWGSVVLEIRHE